MSEDQYTPPGVQESTDGSVSANQPGSSQTQQPTSPGVTPAPATPPAPEVPAAVVAASMMEPESSIKEAREQARGEMTDDGRYIPYGGGIMGWFENSGVMKSEEKNGYKFHTILNADTVRQKLFERWGDSDSINRRATKREVVTELDVKTTLISSSGKYLATTMDFSVHGLRLQLIQEDVGLKKGESIQAQIFKDAERNEIAFDLKASIMWINRTGRRRPIWQMGLGFDNLGFEQSQELKEFFGKSS